jgi:hypothetical protein
MGNSQSSDNKIKFGSVNDPENSRPGYYANGKMIKYHTEKIELLPDELVSSFKKLKYGYAITNKRVFYKGEPLKNVNPNKFEIINRENVSIPELKKLNSVIGIENGKNVYHMGKLVHVIK